MKHNFRANQDIDDLIEAGEALTGNKSAFICQCIAEYGKAAVKTIIAEKKNAGKRALQIAARNKARRR